MEPMFDDGHVWGSNPEEIAVQWGSLGGFDRINHDVGIFDVGETGSNGN